MKIYVHHSPPNQNPEGNKEFCLFGIKFKGSKRIGKVVEWEHDCGTVFMQYGQGDAERWSEQN